MFQVTEEMKSQLRQKQAELRGTGKSLHDVFKEEFLKALNSAEVNTQLYRTLWCIPKAFYVLYGAEKVIDMLNGR